MMATSLRGSLAPASSAIRSAAMLAANKGWPKAKTASWRRSSSAISSRISNMQRICAGVTTGTVMEKYFWEGTCGNALGREGTWAGEGSALHGCAGDFNRGQGLE